jgi:hypothetical protein
MNVKIDPVVFSGYDSSRGRRPNTKSGKVPPEHIALDIGFVGWCASCDRETIMRTEDSYLCEVCDGG